MNFWKRLKVLAKVAITKAAMTNFTTTWSRYLVAIFAAGFVASLLTSCEGELKSNTKLVRDCKKNTTSPKCNLQGADFETTTDSFVVTFSRPDVENRIRVTAGSMNGMRLVIPANSYDEKITIGVDWQAPSLLSLEGRIEGLKSFFGLSSSQDKKTLRPSIKLVGSRVLANQMEITLPPKLYDGFSDEDLEKAQVKLVNGSLASSLTVGEQLQATSKLLRIQTIEWGIYSVVSDIVPPTVTLASTSPQTINEAFKVNVSFSEELESIAIEDFVIVNGSVSNFVVSNRASASGAPASFEASFIVTPLVDGLVSVSIPKSRLKDLFGNSNLEAVTLTRTANMTRPGVLLSSIVPSQTNLTTIPVVVTFSENVTGFELSDILVSNGVASNFTGSGANYSFDVTPSADGDVRVNIPAEIAINGGSNDNSAATELLRTFDSTQPTVILSSSVSSSTNTTPIPVVVTLSEPVVGFSLSDITVTGGVASGLTGSGTTYNVDVTPSGNGVVTVDIAASSFADAAGNNNLAPTTLTRTFDSVLPTLTLSSAASAMVSSGPVSVTATFSKAVTGFAVGDLVLVNAAASNFSGSGSTYSFDLTPSAQGVFSVSVSGAAASDASGNQNSASNTLSFTFDSVVPTVAVTSATPSVTNSSPIPVTVTFSESVTGFVLGDVSVTNATLGNFAGIGSTYTFDVTPSAQGVVTLSVTSSVAVDGAGNNNTASSSFTRTFDSAAPSIVISSTAPSVTNTSPIPLTFTFSESVTGFTLSDITATGGSVSGFSGSGTTYSANVTPSGQGHVTISVAANVAQDGGGNNNTAATDLTRTFDNVAPTVTIASTTSSITSVNPIPVTVTFSEPVSGFTSGDVVIANGTIGSFSGSGASYTFNVTPASVGDVTVDIASSVAQDNAGNNNTAATQLTRTFDSTNASVTLSSAAGATTNVSPIPVTATFSETVTGFIPGDITVGNGTVFNFLGSGTTYTFDVIPSAQGPVTINVAADVAQDIALNGNTAAAQLDRTYDTTSPTVAVTSTAAANSNSSPIPFTITFSEPVTGFVVGDLTITNGTASNFLGSAATYTVDITPTAQGVVSLNILASVAQDAAGNQNTALSAAVSRTFDSVSPSMVISSLATNPTNASPIPVSFTFSEAVTGFALGDITVTNGAASSFSGSGASYTADITPSAQGLVTIAVAANAAQDATGNNNTAAIDLTRTFDSAVPTVALSTTAGSSTSLSSIPVTATFTKSVTGFVVGDITVTNGTASAFSGSGTTYTFTVTPTSQGAVTVQVPANVAVDTASNQNTVSNLLSVTYDTASPTITITSTAPSVTNTSPIPITVMFSESVTGFVMGDISVTGATLAGFSGSGTTYTVNATPTGQGTVTIGVAANMAQDAAGNSNTAATDLTRTFDSVAPTITLTSTAASNTNVSPIPVTATFSESVTGFIVGDVTITNGTASGFSGSGAVYTFDVTPTGQGLVTVNVAANVAQDSGANNNTAATALTRTFDTAGPTVTLTSTAPTATNTSPIPVAVTFSESVTGFDNTDPNITNGTISNFSGSGATYTFDVTPTSQGTVTVALAANRAQDGSGNYNVAATNLTRTFDNVAPTVAITSTAPSVTNTSPIPVTIIFSESVTGFVVGDVTVSGATLSGFSGSGTTYTVNATPSGQGVVTIDVAANAAQDSATNNNTAGTQLSRTFDSVRPTVTISSASSSTTNATPIAVTVTFSESVTGFVVGDLTLSGGTASNFSGNGASYSFDFVPVGQGVKTVNIAANVAQDSGSNNNTAATQLSRTFDSVAPTVTLSSAATNPTATSPIPVTITFSESVTGFVVGDLVVSGATAGSFSGSGTTYSANLTPTGNGTITLDVASGAAQDSGGNNNTAATQLSRVFDTTAPIAGSFSASTSVTDSGFVVNWTAASDAVTATAALEYRLCSGASLAAIDTVAECDAATTEMAYTANTLTRTITGRVPSTTYFYNVVVRDSLGNKAIYPGLSQATSADATPPVAGSFSASTSVTQTSFVLNWSAATDNGTAQSSLEYLVCSGASTAAIDTVAECEASTVEMAFTANTLTKSITGRAPSTTYYYNVVARDAQANKSIYNGRTQATTADTTPPSVGSFSASTGVSETGFTLNWSAATDAVTAQASLEYRVCSGASAAAIDTVAECDAATTELAYTANTLTLAITGKNPSTTYFYNAIVRDGSGNKAIYLGRTQATNADVTLPTAGTFSASTEVGAGSVTLNWTVGSDNITAASSLQYRVCRAATAAAIDTVTECDAATAVMNYTANTTTVVASGLTPSTTFFFNIIVRDGANNKALYEGKSETTTADTAAPTPGNSGTMSASSITATGMTLGWTAGSDDVTTGTSLQYYVCTGASLAAIDTVAECEAATMVANWTINSVSRAVSSLSPSTTYFYNVVVRDAALNKSIYAGITQSTTADTTSPTAGTFSTSPSVGVTSVSLAWTAATDNVTAALNLQYYTCRATSDADIDTVGECEAATQVMNWSPNTLTATASSLAANTTYFFRTIVRDAAGNKSLYPSKSETTLSGFTTTTNGERDSSSQHTFYDSVNDRHWVFYIDGSDLKYRYSADSVTWTSGTAMTAPSPKFVMHYKSVSGTPYVFMVTEENSFDVVLRRGSLTSSTVTFDSPITVFDGTSSTDLYTSPAVVTDDTNVWVAASRFTSTWQAVVRESTNGAGDVLSAWETTANLGSLSGNPKAITLLPKGGEDLYAIYKDGEAVIGYTLVSGAWSAAHTGGDLAWLSLSGTNGVNSGVSVAVWYQGALYIGGSFTQAGGSSANRVARWNGSSWSALGSGMNGAVTALAVSGSDLYVGGSFSSAGGSYTSNVARWNGTSWSALGSGVNGAVTALAVSGSDLYVGGNFNQAGGSSANFVARWNGTSWSALGSGVNSQVYALAVSGSDLYVGGNFNQAGGSSANFVARWNGTSWSALGSGVNYWVYALAVSGSDLYVGGEFSTAGGSSANNVARWNGTSWSALGSGVNSQVYALAVSGSDLYVGGSFTTAGGSSASRMARWNGSSWSALGSGVNSTVAALAVSGSDLYVGGNFTAAGGSSASRVARWNSSSWSALGSGVNNRFYALAVSGSDLYVGGDFTTAGGSSASRVARWNGSTWSTLGSGVNSTVYALAVSGSDLYVGGNFIQAGGSSANYVARWNGTSWSALGSGVNNTVFALTVSGSDLYLGGDFTTAGGSSANYVAKWNGSAWSALGSGVNSTVYALAVSGSDLYVGGFFTTAGGSGANYVAKWSGSTWSTLGSGVNSIINALAVSGSDLYVGGFFTTAGGSGANNVAKWSGSSWSALGSGVNHTVRALAVSGSDLYVGGSFTTAGGSSASRVARWNGSAWSTLGSGVNGQVDALAVSGNQVFSGYANDVSVLNTAVTSTFNSISAAVNNSGDATLTYIDTDGLVKAKTYSGSTWSAATNIQGTGVSFAPQVSSVPGTNRHVAFWYRGGAFEYKRFNGTTWDASPTTLVPASLNSRFASCDPFAGDSIIKCIVTSQSLSPFDVTNWSMTP